MIHCSPIRIGRTIILALTLTTIAPLAACAARAPISEPAATVSEIPPSPPSYRGWGYLVEKLKQKGISESRLKSVFEDPRMPPFSLITFKLKPVESADIYAKFRTIKKLNEGRQFVAKNQAAFDRISREYGVDREVITAILLVETHFGENTGSELVLNRLARVSSVNEPGTLEENFKRISSEQPEVTIEQVRARANYLEETFLPQVVDLFHMTEREKLDIFTLNGSPAGAFGIPQFLPSSYMNFGVDGNGDGSISLYNISDAMFSTARFLQHYGWKKGLTEKQKREVVWNYNHSQAYVDTIFWLASGMAHRRM